MPVYWIAAHTITDAAKFEEYRVKVAPMIARHGGRYITRIGSHKVLESKSRPPDRVVIVEFPDVTALNAWYNSAEYRPLIALRQSAVDMDKETLITLEGA
ncbi:MAG: DUF1330 domain-containing protein [Methylobacteriaceae bacterium]|nr:DUF1330 domain-containing protein [Methylobacteriaceae bacterium]